MSSASVAGSGTALPITPNEKSTQPVHQLYEWSKNAPNVVLLKNALSSLPHGVPTQLSPKVVEINEAPEPLPTGVTLSQ